jgi:hypothetical protein
MIDVAERGLARAESPAKKWKIPLPPHFGGPLDLSGFHPAKRDNGRYVKLARPALFPVGPVSYFFRRRMVTVTRMVTTTHSRGSHCIMLRNTLTVKR